MTDHELIEAFKKGDEKAFTALYKRYELSVTNVFVKNVYNPADVDDLVMLVFTKVFKNIDKYEPTGSFNGWITKITHNTLIDYFRRRKRIPSTIENTSEERDYYIETIPTDDDTPEQVYIRKQDSLILREIVKTLKERERKVVELRFFKEMRYEDIAKELKLPLGTIKAQIYRVKQLLNKKIKEKAKEDDTILHSSQE